ncbi:PorP/SprF family type IX secretion system membrane protein [Rufibacter quisquiliarum]|uniref:Type IX secretion system PorP/SprF family membrane protein n=1 Tax=Rufibacter quisquiliarum TaxID=1549639 RepID=A0A839GK69_9BACT|nr:type IX secretion system membrane protein PorP/SprF [Rufibacter quisquiliarum]MBA9075985.1 type IX secretion system PorP/SprF family membrane protein [Rufibacter quisquiliarum]
MKAVRICVLGLALIGLVSMKGRAQQIPQYSQYMTNSVVVNPAVAGIESYTDIRASFRKQWVGLEESPITFYTSIHASIGKNDRNAPAKNKFKRSSTGVTQSSGVNKNNRFYRVNPHHGVGAIVQVDRAGLLTATSVNLMYAYHLPITNVLNVSTGISAGVVRNSFNTAQAKAVDQSDPTLAGDNTGSTKADASLGIWVYTSKAFLGISGTHLINSGSDFKDAYSTAVSGKIEPHYFITAGYRVKINRDLMLTPSIMYRKATPTPASFDFNIKALYSERMWVGLSYRKKDSFTLLGGLNINHLLDFGYSYDVTTSELNEASAGSHEILIGFKVNNKRKIICPQWIW